MILVFDDVISSEENMMFRNRILEENTLYGVPGKDNQNDPIDSISCDFSTDYTSPELSHLKQKIFDRMPILKDYDNYLNHSHTYPPGSIPNWHQDIITKSSNVKTYTAIFFFTPENHNYNDLGTLDFKVQDGDSWDIKGVWAKPRRLVIFDGYIFHRANSFRNIDRVVLALKFQQDLLWEAWQNE